MTENDVTLSEIKSILAVLMKDEFVGVVEEMDAYIELRLSDDATYRIIVKAA